MTKYDFPLLVLLCICIVIIGAPVACTVRQSELVAEAIKNGADPIQARCAIVGSSEINNELCQ